MVSVGWDRYMEWNAAVADVCFPPRNEPTRVYLTIDEEVVRLLSDHLRIPEKDFESELAAVVNDVLRVRWSAERAFDDVLRELTRWRRQESDTPPPTLPVLVALSLAAGHMSSSGEVDSQGYIHETNYYARLVGLLNVPPSKKDDLAQAYRTAADELWEGLNHWLKRCGFRRGIPTAEPLGTHRYVGWALSQALVRRADRERMKRFFAEAALPAGAELLPAELETLFDHWMQEKRGAARAMQHLWGSEELRAKVVEVLAEELLQWDGQDSTLDKGERSQLQQLCKLVLAYRSFPRKEISVTGLAYFDSWDEPRAATLLAGPAEVSIELEPEIPGALRFGQGILNRDLLEALLRIEDPVTRGSVVRRPKRLVVFRKEARSSLWLETVGVLPAEELRLLCRNDILPELTALLDVVSTENITRVDSAVQGAPEGWTLLLGVRITKSVTELVPPNRKEFHQLEPVVQSQIQLSGGLQLPGRRLTWHSSRLPEVQVVQEDSPGFTVNLIDATQKDDELILGSWDDGGRGHVIFDPAEEGELEPGEYRVVARHHESGQTLSRTFKVLDSSRSGPELPRWTSDICIPDPLVAIGVDPAGVEQHQADIPVPDTDLIVSGPDEGEPGLPPQPWWNSKYRPAGGEKQIHSLPSVPADSCLFTGAHHWTIPLATDARGRANKEPSQGQCKHCGTEKRFENNYWRNARRYSRAQQQVKGRNRQFNRARGGGKSPAVNSEQRTIPWNAIADALITMESGSWASLLALVRQVDESGPAVFHIIHSLEAIGLLEVLRSGQTLEPEKWRLVPPEVLQLEDGTAELRGGWSRAARKALRAELGVLPAIVSPPAEHPLDGGPDIWTFDVSHSDVALPQCHWQELGEKLPVISAVIDALPRRDLLRSTAATKFHVPSASWAPVSRIDSPGAFRVQGRAIRDFVCTEADLAAGEMAMSQVRFSKHAACFLLAQRPLMAYHRATEELIMPLGADLPGLYNRFAVLAGGQLPRRSGSNIVYSAVPPEVARTLEHRLSH